MQDLARLDEDFVTDGQSNTMEGSRGREAKKHDPSVRVAWAGSQMQYPLPGPACICELCTVADTARRILLISQKS